MGVRFPFLNRLFNTSLFYGGWVLCLKDVSSLYGAGAVSLIIAYQLYCSSYRKADLALCGLMTFLGPLSDSFYAHLGLLHYHSPLHSISWLPPLWIFLLWGLVAVNMSLFSWLKKKWFLAALLGAVGGPASYLSAIRLGGASTLVPLPLSLTVIGVCWAILFPSLMWLSEWLKKWFK